MLPFSVWVESEGNPALGEPQDQMNDDGKGLDGVVEVRMEAMLSELMQMGNERQKVMDSVQNYLKKHSVPVKQDVAGQGNERSGYGEVPPQ
jgi:hypothetical protein